jgi:predicted permease
MQGRIGWHQAKQAAASVTLKLAVHPLIVCLLAMALGGLPPASIAVATITASLPAGMNVYLMARQYDCYVDEATATTTLGTLLSVLSIALALQFSLGFH